MKNKVTLTLNGKSVEVELTAEQLKELGMVEEKKELLERKGWYYCKCSDNSISHKIRDSAVKIDNSKLESGNYYSSKKIAEKSIDNFANRIKTWILEENEKTGWETDWNDGEGQYYIFYNDGKYCVGRDMFSKRIGVIYTSYGSAKKLCKLLNDGWR